MTRIPETEDRLSALAHAPDSATFPCNDGKRGCRGTCPQWGMCK